MKKIISILVIGITFISCEKSDKITIDKDEYNKLKGVTLEYPKYFELYDEGLSYSNNIGIILGSDKHEYLVTNWGNNGQTIEHYIDCNFCAKRNENRR